MRVLADPGIENDGARKGLLGAGEVTPIDRAEFAEEEMPLRQGRIQPEGVLHGSEAWHHLVRTAVGLNSTLPGERDVADQLASAHRLAQQTGTVGPLMNDLMAEVSRLGSELRGCTEWGQFGPDYCYAATSRIVQATGLDLRASRITVIGGSTTSAAVLGAMTDRFDVPSRQLTLIYRGHAFLF